MAIAQTAISDNNRRTGRQAWLRPLAAASYERAKQAGLPGGCVSDAGRTNAEQWDMWHQFQAGLLPATAAYPGTSRHETGDALDLAEPARAWMRTYGLAHGWIAGRVRNEPWHFEYEPDADEHLIPTLPAPKEILMKETIVLVRPDGRCYLYSVVDGVCEYIPNPVALAKLGKRYAGEQVRVSDADFTILADMALRVRQTLARTIKEVITA